jgi:hypothetical protein
MGLANFQASSGMYENFRVLTLYSRIEFGGVNVR